MKKIFLILATALLGLTLVAPAAHAIAPKQIEVDWTYLPYMGKSSLASSTHSVTGIGRSYSILIVGSSATATIHHTTRTYAGNVSPAISSSSVLNLADGIALSDEFWALTVNPSIVIHGMSTSATSYIGISYGTRRQD